MVSDPAKKILTQSSLCVEKANPSSLQNPTKDRQVVTPEFPSVTSGFGFPTPYMKQKPQGTKGNSGVTQVL